MPETLARLLKLVSFYINHHTLQKETSVIRSESSTDLWVEVSLILCPFIRILVAGSYLRLASFPTIGSCRFHYA